MAVVVPIFKKGNKHEASNYRPVSLTSVSCKVIESVIKDAIVTHLEQQQFYADCQHGFMKRRSTLTNLLVYWKKAPAGRHLFGLHESLRYSAPSESAAETHANETG